MTEKGALGITDGTSLSLRERARVRDIPKLDNAGVRDSDVGVGMPTLVSDPTHHSPLLPNVGNRYNVRLSRYRGGCNHDET